MDQIREVRRLAGLAQEEIAANGTISVPTRVEIERILGRLVEGVKSGNNTNQELSGALQEVRSQVPMRDRVQILSGVSEDLARLRLPGVVSLVPIRGQDIPAADISQELEALPTADEVLEDVEFLEFSQSRENKGTRRRPRFSRYRATFKLSGEANPRVVDFGQRDTAVFRDRVRELSAIQGRPIDGKVNTNRASKKDRENWMNRRKNVNPLSFELGGYEVKVPGYSIPLTPSWFSRWFLWT